MTLSVGPNLGLLVDGAQGEEHYEALMLRWRWLDFLIQPVVSGWSCTEPSEEPFDGEVRLLAESGCTGVWATHENKIARWSAKESAWEFLAPHGGWTVLTRAGKRLIFNNNNGRWELETPPRRVSNEGLLSDYYISSPDDFENYLRLRPTADLNVDFQSATTSYPFGVELVIANRSTTYNLTITDSDAGITFNAPRGGSLVLGPGDTVTVKFISGSEADVYGSTLAP